MAAGFRSPLPILGLSEHPQSGFLSPLPFLGLSSRGADAGFGSPLFLLGLSIGVPVPAVEEHGVYRGRKEDEEFVMLLIKEFLRVQG